MGLILVVMGAIVITALAHRRDLEPALIIVVVAFAISFVPGAPVIQFQSGLLLSIVLPPLLYSEALDFSVPVFLHNIRPIIGLGVVLVLVTAFAVAGVVSWHIAMGFGPALVLGAVVAPPDAVTAVAVGRRLGLPKKVMAILTGESLINDAAALSLFSIAIAHVAGTHAFIDNPVLLFFYSASVGPAVGAAIGFTTLWIRRHLAHPGLETVQSLVTPFAAYLAAEDLHSSGVLAVVVAGFVVGHGSLQANYKTRLQEQHLWHSIDVLLEAFVFAYIGLDFRFVLQDLQVWHESLVDALLTSLVILAVVLLVRPPCVFLMFGVPLRKLIARLTGRSHPATRSRAMRTRGRRRLVAIWPAQLAPRRLTWQENVVLSWTGMRGVVTLAAASGIPLVTANGDPFPQRATIQFIAFVVSVGTLLLQGWTLPLLIDRLRLSAGEDDAYLAAETIKAEKVVHHAADEVLRRFYENPPPDLDERVVANIRLSIAHQSQIADEAPDPQAHTRSAEVFAEVYQQVLIAQRVALITERDAGRLDDVAVRAMLERLDLQEAGVSARMYSRL